MSSAESTRVCIGCASPLPVLKSKRQLSKCYKCIWKDVKRRHALKIESSANASIQCTECKTSKPLSSFQAYMKICMACRGKKSTDVLDFVRKIREESKCADCGNGDWRVLQFAHYNRSEKARTKTGHPLGIFDLRSREKIEEELLKGRWLCAVCHDKETTREREDSKEAREDEKTRNLQILQEKLKRSVCFDCDMKVVKEEASCFGFYHEDASTKLFCVSQASKKRSHSSTIQTEIEKCVLLCSNCRIIRLRESEGVWPNIATSPISSGYHPCGTSSGQNGQCFINQPNPNTAAFAEGARRVAFLDMNFQGSNNQFWGVYSRIAPLRTYFDPEAFLRAYTFTTYGFWGPSTGAFAASTPASCSTTFSHTISWPLNPVMQAGNTLCIDPAFWNTWYTGSTCTNNNQNYPQFNGAPLFPFAVPYPDPNFVEYPAFFGDIETGFNGEILFRTLGVTNTTVQLHYLVQTQVITFNSSTGFSRTPLFFGEWVTAPGYGPGGCAVSVPEDLIAQYYSVGLTTPYHYDPTGANGAYAFPFAYIPTNPFQVPYDCDCHSDACVLNRESYLWNGTQYTIPLYSEVITGLDNPQSCSPTFDCSTVGAGAKATGLTPAPCPPNAGQCCNSAGFACFVNYNGTDSNGLTLIDVINITIPNFVQVANTLAQAPVNFSYADTQAAANLINDMSAFIFAKLPNIANNGFGLGQLIGGLVDGVDAIANGIAAIANTVFGDVWSLFSGAFGLAAGLFAFLPYIFTIVVVGGVALCFFYILKQSGVLDQLKRNNAQSEVTESQVLLQANRSTHPAVGGSAKYR